MTAIRHGAKQAGLASIEFALTLPILVLLMAFPLFLGHVFWHYTAMQRAANDATRFLSKAPITEITSPSQAAKVVKVANDIVKEELSDVSASTYYFVGISCDAVPCAGVFTPATVTVSIQMIVYSPFPLPSPLSIPLMAMATYPYAGR
jgi:Flp pilus assembly protein TadG